MEMKNGVSTVSERAGSGVDQNQGGPAVISVLTEFLVTPWQAYARMAGNYHKRPCRCILRSDF